MKIGENFDGNKAAEKREDHLANNPVHTITNANIEIAVEEQVNYMTSKIEVLDQRHVEGTEPTESGRKIVLIAKLAIDIFETKPLRGSSYIENPEKLLECKMRANQHQERGRGVLQMVHEVSPVHWQNEQKIPIVFRH